jgi:TRAP-type C4-dicarboxylate transport system permease small subunit
MPQTVSKLFRRVYDHLEEAFCALLVGVMVACLMAQVGVRWTTGMGLAWTEELSRFTFLWTVFVGAALVAKQNSHVRITAQFLLLPVKVRLALRVLTDAIWIGFNLYIAWQSWQIIREGLLFPEISPTLKIVKAYVEVIIPFGFAFMSWRILEGYIIRWRRGTLLELVRYVQEKEVL